MSESLPDVRWGVLGNARVFRRRFLPAMESAKGARLVAVASRRGEDGCRDLEAERRGVRIHAGYEALLGDEDVDAVYIPLPNSLHATGILEALEAGKHVLCEKPLAVTVEDCRRMVAAARHGRRILAEAFQFRYHPRMEAAGRMVRRGDIGRPKALKAVFTYTLDMGAPNVRLRSSLGGGALRDVGCYGVHAARFLLGAEPEGAEGRCLVRSDRGVDLDFEGTLSFRSGAEAVVKCSFLEPFESRLRVWGEEGSLDIPMAFQPQQDARLILEKGGKEEILEVEGPSPYVLQLEAVSQAILSGTPPRVDGEDGLKNVAVVTALLESADTSGPVGVRR